MFSLGMFAVLSALCTVSNAQVAEIPTQKYKVLFINSQSATDTVQKAFDGDTNTWWALNTSQAKPLPAELVLDLGDTLRVCGFRYQCNPKNTSDKLLRYAVYVSNDTAAWGDTQAYTRLFWQKQDETSGKEALFGAIRGRYVKLVYLSNTNTWNRAIQTAELRLLQDEQDAPVRKNQHINGSFLPALVSALDTTTLSVTASSQLAVRFEVVSGPGAVHEKNGKWFLTCSGAEGAIILDAVQDGNDVYYPVKHRFLVNVQNPNFYGIKLLTPLVENEPIVMPSDTLCYPIWARAEIGSTFNRITQMSVEIDGKPVQARWNEKEATIRADFRPQRYGEFSVRFHAVASNGRDTTITRTIMVDSAENSRTVRSFEHMLINFPDPGRTNGGVFTFPQHVGSYQRIVAKLDIKCPDIPGGCDDWDRVAWIEVQTPDGQWREIIRYVTAYGVPCHHWLDVSDFASYLQGEVPMRMFVDTWGSGGYDVTLDFNFIKGMPQYLYTGIVPLWSGNFPFGDPANLQPMDTLLIPTPENAAALNMKVVTTGHGWGDNNSKNAAEFYKASHTIYVNGQGFDHTPWMKCNPNPDTCKNQRGTWTYNRAGWCPGAIAPGYNYNLTMLREEKQLDFRFIMQPSYVDLCHPNNPDCVSGKTCKDCKDTYNPQYYIASYLISYHNKMYDSLPDVANEQTDERKDIAFGIYPNPASDRFFVQAYAQTGSGYLQVFNMSGDLMMNRIFAHAAELTEQAFDVSQWPTGVYFVKLQTRDGQGLQKLVVR